MADEFTLEQQQAIALANARARAAAAANANPAGASTPPDANTAPAPANGGAGMTLEQQDAAMQAQRADRSADDVSKHAASLTGRMAVQGGISGPAALPALATDAGINLGYGIRKLAHWAAPSMVDPANPDKYRALSGGSDTYFPTLTAVGKLATGAADKLGLDQPETKLERILTSTGEGLASGGAGALGAKLMGLRALGAQPVMQAASGAASGAAAQTATEAGLPAPVATAAGLAAGFLPTMAARTPGRVTIDSEAGQRSAAAEALRSQVSGDLPGVINTAREARAVTPGFTITGVNATKDPGLARASGLIEQWSNNAPGTTINDVTGENARALGRGLDRFAEPGGATTRRVQRASDAATLGELNLAGQPPVDITHLLRGMDTNPRAVGADVAAANAEMKRRLIAVSKPVVNEKGEILGYRANPQRLHEERTSFMKDSVQRQAAQGSAPGVDNSALQRSASTARGVADEITAHLNDVTDGAYASRYLAPSHAGRTAADNQSFMQDFRENVMPQNSAEGKLNGDTWVRNVRSRADKTLPGGRNMRYDQLDPMRQSFLAGAANDIEANNFSRDIRGRGNLGGNKRDLAQTTVDLVNDRRSPMMKAGNALLAAGGYLAAPAARIFGGAPVNLGLRAGGAVASDSAKFESRLRAVQDIVGRSATSGRATADLLETPLAYNPGIKETLGLNAKRSLLMGAPQGFLAGERAKRYR